MGWQRTHKTLTHNADTVPSRSSHAAGEKTLCSVCTVCTWPYGHEDTRRAAAAVQILQYSTVYTTYIANFCTDCTTLVCEQCVTLHLTIASAVCEECMTERHFQPE